MSDVTTCFGCRAKAQAARVPDDELPVDGESWETFTCTDCGVEDIRLAAALTKQTTNQESTTP